MHFLQEWFAIKVKLCTHIISLLSYFFAIKASFIFVPFLYFFFHFDIF